MVDSGKLLTERVADKIVQTIIEKKLKAGDKLPNEFELASQLGVGRSTIREAIKTLVSRNLVEIRRGSGTFVSYRNGVSEDPLGLEFLTDQTRVAADLLELRFMLEPRLAMLAAGNATKQEVAELLELCDKLEAGVYDSEEFMTYNTRLHAAIARASGNVVIPNLAVILCGPASALRGTLSESNKKEWIQSTREIVSAISARDGLGAHDAMLLHLAICRRAQAELALQ